MDILLSVEDVAEVLGVKPATLYEWRYRKKGPPSFKVCGAVRYRESEIERWLQEQENAPRGAKA